MLFPRSKDPIPGTLSLGIELHVRRFRALHLFGGTHESGIPAG